MRLCDPALGVGAVEILAKINTVDIIDQKRRAWLSHGPHVHKVVVELRRNVRAINDAEVASKRGMSCGEVGYGLVGVAGDVDEAKWILLHQNIDGEFLLRMLC